jgi:glycosyltransferase involved in cell wall biosynthesis
MDGGDSRGIRGGARAERTLMKHVVLSAINVHAGGTLTIVRDFLRALSGTPAFRRRDFDVVLFCHRSEAYADLAAPGVTLLEIPLSRTSWAMRLFFEYVWFRLWSRRRQIDVWLSLHDMTPNVRARRRFVYCHNPAPFYRGPSLWRWEPRFELFRRFYKWMYLANLHRNEAVIVQQEWMRQAFVQRLGSDPARTIVARPVAREAGGAEAADARPRGSEVRLLFPAVPRPFKNFDTLLRAMRRLEDEPVRLILTISGAENRLSRALKRQYGDLRNVDFIGFVPQAELFRLYGEVDALVFPSLLESWGLPLSEFRTFGKPVFAADRDYAREALSGYDNAVFFDPGNPAALADLLRRFVSAREVPRTSSQTSYAPPYAASWEDLIGLLGLA